ncbi:MAG: SRPBCC family protein [Bacteroidota bacterium]
MENPHGTFQLSAIIPAPREAVYAFFSDPNHTRELQPYVKSVTILREEIEDEIRTIHFTSLEYVPMLGGLWKQKNAIEAQWILTQPPHRMEATAYSKPGVRLHLRYAFAPTPEGNTHMTLEVRWQAPRVFRGIVPREAAKAQQGVLDRLRDHFSNG